MDPEIFSTLDLPTLRQHHAQAVARLHAALLDGASWEELREFRRDLTELEIALHRRQSAPTDPAASAEREG